MNYLRAKRAAWVKPVSPVSRGQSMRADLALLDAADDLAVTFLILILAIFSVMASAVARIVARIKEILK